MKDRIPARQSLETTFSVWSGPFTSCSVGHSCVAVAYFLHASSSKRSRASPPESGPVLSALSCKSSGLFVVKFEMTERRFVHERGCFRRPGQVHFGMWDLTGRTAGCRTHPLRIHCPVSSIFDDQNPAAIAGRTSANTFGWLRAIRLSSPGRLSRILRPGRYRHLMFTSNTPS